MYQLQSSEDRHICEQPPRFAILHFLPTDINSYQYVTRYYLTFLEQRYFSDTDVGDTLEGHGTHVCGTALGAAAGATVAAPAPDFDGMAYNAKLAFDDISSDGSTLNIPVDLNTGLFPHPYGVGARCCDTRLCFPK